MLITIATVLTTSLIVMSKLSDKKANLVLKIVSILLFCCEFTQDMLLIHEGVDWRTILPLHLCNIGIFINILACFTKGKVSGYFAEVSLVLNMPGALGAILFPDWNYRPFWNWLSLMCFFTHTLLTFIPLALLIRGRTHVKFTHFWYSFLFIAIITGPIYYLDQKMRVNYMFLRYPVDGSPLEWVYDLSNGEHYIFGLVCLLFGVLAVEYVLIVSISTIVKKIRQKKAQY